MAESHLPRRLKMPTKAKAKKAKKIIRRRLTFANVYIQASFNNTLVTLTDSDGNVVASSSAGMLNFSGTRKATPHAATQVMQSIVSKIKDFGISEVNVKVNGVGVGRDAALRALAASPIIIKTIEDITPIPHNGPRPRKARRV